MRGVSELNVKLLLMAVMIFAGLSCAATLASYFYYTKPFMVDAEIVYRGWPLSWMTESWSSWSEPPFPHHVSFQTANFMIDFLFYAVVFQIPSQLYLYSREIRKQRVQVNDQDKSV